MTNAELDIAAAPRRVFTAEEANRQLPAIEAVFRAMDTASASARELGDLVADLEAYWGRDVEDPANADHERCLALRRELAEALRDVNEGAIRLRALGCELRDANRGLVDFYAYANGETAYLCWQRGEREVAHWHPLESGCTGRRPLGDRRA